MIWVYIVFALVSMFLSSGGKKPTAKDAAVGVAAGLGAYYVGTQTEWGRSTVSSIEDSLGLQSNGVGTATTADGTATSAVSTATGSTLAGLGAGISSTAKSLVPLALAAGAGAAVGSSDTAKYLLVGGGLLAAFWLFGRKKDGGATVVVSGPAQPATGGQQ